MDFAFLIHSRDYTDVARKFKVAKYLPRAVIEYWCRHWPPVLVSRVTGLKDKAGAEVKGYIIGIPMTAKQMMENRDLAKKRVIAAVNMAEKLGAKIVGLGALTSSVTGGGELIKDEVKIGITTGNALTVAVTFEHIKKFLVSDERIKNIAIVGGTGSIGQALIRLLAKNYPTKHYKIYGRTKINLDNLTEELKAFDPNLDLESHANDLSTLHISDLIAVATSASDALINSSHLKHNAIVYDMTQPQNVDRKTREERPDLTIIDGGLIFIPELASRLPFGLPPKTAFACFGETALLACENWPGSFSTGKVKLENVEIINRFAINKNFEPVKI